MEEHDDQWRVLGRHYGYPKCCIDSFCSLMHLGEDYFTENHWAYGTGFVPCKECVTIPEEEMLRIIAENRQAKYPFPRESMKETDEILRKFQ